MDQQHITRFMDNPPPTANPAKEPPKSGSDQRLVRHSLPPRTSPRFGEVPQCRVSISLPLIIHIDCDDSMTDDQIKDLWRRVFEDEIRIDIMGHAEHGAYHLRCNHPLPNVKVMAPPLAGASVDRGVEDVDTVKHREQRG